MSLMQHRKEIAMEDHPLPVAGGGLQDVDFRQIEGPLWW